jgi:hypothetical protein
MYPATLSCRRPNLQLLRLSGTCLTPLKSAGSCQKRIEPISGFGEQKVNPNHI